MGHFAEEIQLLELRLVSLIKFSSDITWDLTRKKTSYGNILASNKHQCHHLYNEKQQEKWQEKKHENRLEYSHPGLRH